eukprot:2239964-Amphidinium_carterae.1
MELISDGSNNKCCAREDNISLSSRNGNNQRLASGGYCKHCTKGQFKTLITFARSSIRVCLLRGDGKQVE